MDRRILVTAGLALIAAIHSGGPAEASDVRTTGWSQDDSSIVAGVIERFHTAMGLGDSAAVMGLLTSDVVILESGDIETRADYQAHHLPADIAYAKSMKTTRSAIRVTVRGDVAWASSTSVASGNSRGTPSSSAGAELMVLTRTPSGWRIAAIHWSSRAVRSPT